MLKSIDEPCAASATLPAAAAVARRYAAATSRAHRISTFQIGMASGLPCQCALMPLAEQSSQLTFIGGDGARNDQDYDRKALTQVWQFSSYSAESPDYGRGLESDNSRGSSCSSQSMTTWTRRHAVNRVWLWTLAAVNDANYETIITNDIYWR